MDQNTESLNLVLKGLVDWKSEPLLELVQKLSEYTDAKYKDVRRAIVRVGQYRLSHTQKSWESEISCLKLVHTPLNVLLRGF